MPTILLKERVAFGNVDTDGACLSSPCAVRMQLACMKPESLVIAGQSYGGESVPGLSTHRLSHYGSWPCPKSLP
ncbi:hypothetical protein R6Q57_005824 [Mikania cordata]